MTTSHFETSRPPCAADWGSGGRRCGPDRCCSSPSAQGGCPQGVDNGHAPPGPEAVIHPPCLPCRGGMSTQNGHGGAPHGRGGPVDFLTVFNDPTLCATLPLDAVAPLLMQIAAGMTRLTALQTALAARVLAAQDQQPTGPEHLLDVQEAAARLGMSADWLYRHAKRLPFTRRVGRRAVKFDPDGPRPLGGHAASGVTRRSLTFVPTRRI